ncbi:gamma carbonic anhydrase family protein [Halalkalibacter krulwichiae]|uniref:UDP-3-O-[3-hydroxymyristoyl] glucosamine N-acyltransferase n=1 Tax=Halalkalibacter krulwichiae TaxID=199441 RepID=A0A1X9MHZ9_9BACI|nr:gamma carbonic anhydrase family protein [Halalkalibacter krulwichiae]ARK30172.1 UDP-3-O-[3-hydroxymyristoyl] glucosamine N-acyltransferase [Halalkalibacter krulwichiae]
MIYPYKGKTPVVDESVFIAPGAAVIGDVVVGEQSSIWFNAVLRGDEGKIEIGNRCSVQDNVSIHLFEGMPVIVEDEVTIGHNAIIHGSKIGRRSIVGMGSTILDGVEIGEECIIGANTFIPQGKKIPPRSLVIGSPGEVVRSLNEKDLDLIQLSIDTYIKRGQEYKEEL